MDLILEICELAKMLPLNASAMPILAVASTSPPRVSAKHGKNRSFAGLGKLIKTAVANAITTEQNFGVVISLTASIRLIEPEFLPADLKSGRFEFRQSL